MIPIYILVAALSLLENPAQKAVSPAPPAAIREQPSALAESARQKLVYIKENGQRPSPDQTTTVLAEREINDFLAHGGLSLPRGIKNVRVEGRSGWVLVLFTADFDLIRSARQESSPLLEVFRGTRDLRVELDATALEGRAWIHVRQVTIDDVVVPTGSLQYFVQKYIAPAYPHVSLDVDFPMPYRIQTAVVGNHKILVTQK